VGLDATGDVFSIGYEASGYNNFSLTTDSKLVIDTNGNVLVGKTVASLGNVGCEVKPLGEVKITTTASQSLQLNRLSTDGNIVLFKKDGTTVGSIGNYGGRPYFAGPNTATGGFRLDSTSTYGVIIPTTITGANRDSAVDLGYASTGRFRNLHLSGTANVGNINATTGADLATSSGQVVVGASSGSTWAAANMFISSTTGADTTGYSSIVIGNMNNATSSHRGAGFLFVSANAATGGSDSDDIYFGHRNNAGTGEGAPSIISSYKTSGADTSDLRFRYGTGAGGASTEAMRIHSSGNVGIGRSSPSHILHINGVGRSTQSTWATSSDERVKENIVNHEAALDKINQLRPVSFNFKKEYRDNNSTETGFISQEFKLVFPDAVQEVEENYGKLTETDEETQETTVIDEGTTITDFNVLSTACLLPAMVKAIQEQNALIEALTARIEVLEA